MRTAPIEPAELREWLIAAMIKYKEAMATVPEDQRAPYQLGMHTLEAVRHHFLQDLSLYDEPTADVVARSLGVTHTSNVGTTTPKKEI